MANTKFTGGRELPFVAVSEASIADMAEDALKRLKKLGALDVAEALGLKKHIKE